MLFIGSTRVWKKRTRWKLDDTMSLIKTSSQCLKKRNKCFLLFYIVFFLLLPFWLNSLIFISFDVIEFFKYCSLLSTLHMTRAEKKYGDKIAISKLCNFLSDFLKILLRGNNLIFFFLCVFFLVESAFFLDTQNIYNARNVGLILIKCLHFTDEQRSREKDKKGHF